MKPVIQCFVVLTCMAIWTSAAILKCRCLSTSKSVNESLITDVTVIQPRSYCTKQQIICKLKDSRLVCLNPDADSTKIFLKEWASKNHTTSSKPNTASSVAVKTV